VDNRLHQPAYSRRPALPRLKRLAAVLMLALACPIAVAADSESDTSKVLNTLHSFTDRATSLAIEAMSLIGIQYRRGGNSPEHGLDCSGLVRYVFREARGAELPRTSAEISKLGENIQKQDLQPGDLVFFNTLKHAFSHVGIYLGDNKFIHSPSAGGAVRIESMDLSYWKARFNGARRISENETSASR
jgi:cell wall-associated NlpC family hydrolase